MSPPLACPDSTDDAIDEPTGPRPRPALVPRPSPGESRRAVLILLCLALAVLPVGDDDEPPADPPQRRPDLPGRVTGA